MEYLFVVGNSRRENLKEGMHRLLFTVAFLLFISISIHVFGKPARPGLYHLF